MLEGCPGSYKICGTVKPGYLDGSHPNTHEGRVSRNVCFKTSSSCSVHCNAIAVRKCFTFFVYLLKEEIVGTLGCPARYCGSD